MLNGGAHRSFEVEATSYASDRCRFFKDWNEREYTTGNLIKMGVLIGD
jgi:hypothetical protein